MLSWQRLESHAIRVEGYVMKFFIINSFRFLVYIAYFGIIALYTFGAYPRAGADPGHHLAVHRQREDAGGRGWFDLDPGWSQEPSGSGMVLAVGLSALSIIVGLIMGWIAATMICGVLVTLLDIRDDINDRLPRAK